jgi:hypothetical protein
MLASDPGSIIRADRASRNIGNYRQPRAPLLAGLHVGELLLYWQQPSLRARLKAMAANGKRRRARDMKLVQANNKEARFETTVETSK